MADISTITALDGVTYNLKDATARSQISSLVTGVSGVKGNAETTYRQGNVNLTAENVGAIPYNASLFTTNTFAADPLKLLYISKIDNAFFALDKRYTVTATYDGSPYTNVAQFFDGNYEGNSLHIEDDKVAVITMDFSAGSGSKFYGYPYGYIFVSFYYNNIPKQITGRVYNNYSPQGVGWKDLTFTEFSRGIYVAYQQYYGLQTLEITMVGSGDTPYGYTSPTEIEMHNTRPDPVYHSPIVTKFAPQTLYYNLTAPAFIGALQGNATTATTLATARTIQTNLASNSAASFNGSANVTPGVTGILPVAHGGTGVSALDDELDDESLNPVQNAPIAKAVNEINANAAVMTDGLNSLGTTVEGHGSTINSMSADIGTINESINSILALLNNINPEEVEKIQAATNAVASYIWAVVENNSTTVYKGLKGRNIQDYQTESTWGIVLDNTEILGVANGQANASTLEVKNELKLGPFTIHVDENGWSMT